MKKLSVLLMVLLSMSLYSQTWMQIQKADGGKDSIKLMDISKIYFTSTASTFSCGTSTVDYSGKTYHTIQIGTQCWLKENLDVGTMIQGIADASNNSIIEKYCYGNNAANCTNYGGLYQWNEVMQYVTTEKAKGICPNGWHIPTKAELGTLLVTVGYDGNKLKREDQGTGIGVGTNTSGFSSLLVGYRADGGTISGYGNYAYFWSTAEYNSASAYGLFLYGGDSDVSLDGGYDKEVGFSVRCLKD